MLNTIDLNKIERKAYRSTFEDGLMDMLLGAIIASTGIYMYRPDSGYSPINIIGMVLIFVVLQGLYQVGKKYITQPRMGQVRFGPTRKQRRKTMAVILGVIIFFQLVLVGLTSLGWLIPALGENLFGSIEGYSSERLVVAALGSLFVGLPMLVMAYMTDYPRGYYISVLLALAVFLMILTNEPIYSVVIGAIIILPGLVLFIRFLRKYPLPQGDQANG
jgi:hypothetical protein